MKRKSFYFFLSSFVKKFNKKKRYKKRKSVSPTWWSNRRTSPLLRKRRTVTWWRSEPRRCWWRRRRGRRNNGRQFGKPITAEVGRVGGAARLVAAEVERTLRTRYRRDVFGVDAGAARLSRETRTTPPTLHRRSRTTDRFRRVLGGLLGGARRRWRRTVWVQSCLY